MTTMQLKERLEQSLAMTCTKQAMQKLMQTPFKSMEFVSIDALREDDKLHLFKDGL